MTEIKYIVGDATELQGEGMKIILHIVNNQGVWGAGFVRALSNKWPFPEAAYRLWFKDKETFKLGEVQIVPVDKDIVVANMIGQVMGYIDNIPPIRYSAVREALTKVQTYCIQYNVSVHAPRIGCNLAGGSWKVIEQIIIEELCTYNISVTIYDFVDVNSISYSGTPNK